MKKIVVCGAILSLVLWACDDTSSNPASSAAISSSSESSASVSSSSENASSAVAGESQSSSSETQKSSSSRGPLFSSSSKIYDPNYGVCCPDTLYIENGDSTYHQPKPGCVPYPPSIMTYQCVPPVVVNKDSLKALSSSSSGTLAPRVNCIAATDVLKSGYSKYLKKFFLHESKKGDCQIEIPFAKDLCEVNADVSFKRSGDTLSVEYANVRSETTCTCLYNHKFDIPVEYKDVKYFVLDGAVYEYSPDEVDIIWP